MTDLDEIKIPLNDYFVKVKQVREENKTTTDFMQLIDSMKAQKEELIVQNQVKSAYRMKAVQKSKDIY